MFEITVIDFSMRNIWIITISGKEPLTYYWHGRDNSTNMELNPKVLFFVDLC